MPTDPLPTTAQEAVARLLAQCRIVLACPSQLMPGEPAKAALLPGNLDPQAFDLLSGSLSLAGVAKSLPFNTTDMPPVPSGLLESADVDTVAATLASVASTIKSTVVTNSTPVSGTTVPPAGTKALGMAGEVVAGFAVPMPKAKVTLQWRVTTTPEPTATGLSEEMDFVAGGGLQLPQVELLFPPIVQEMTFEALAKPKLELRYLWADVTVAFAGEKTTVPIGPLTLTIFPLLVPTACVLFRFPGYSPVWGGKANGFALAVVPKDSPFTQLSDVMGEYRKVAQILTRLRRLGGRFAALAQFLLGIETLARALAAQPGAAFVVADQKDNGVPDFGVVRIEKRYGMDWFPTAGVSALEQYRDRHDADATFQDRASALILLGTPGARAKLFNFVDYELVRDGKRGGDFVLEVGAEGVVMAPELKMAKPATVPPGRMVDHQGNDFNDKMFGNTLSALNFLPHQAPPGCPTPAPTLPTTPVVPERPRPITFPAVGRLPPR